MDILFEGLLAIAYFCAGTACAGIVIVKAGETAHSTGAAAPEPVHRPDGER